MSRAAVSWFKLADWIWFRVQNGPKCLYENAEEDTSSQERIKERCEELAGGVREAQSTKPSVMDGYIFHAYFGDCGIPQVQTDGEY